MEKQSSQRKVEDSYDEVLTVDEFLDSAEY